MKPWEKYAGSSGGGKPWERYGQAATEVAEVDRIDFEGPDLAVNSMIGLLPDDQRQEALTRQQVMKQRKERAELPAWAQPVQAALDTGVNLARGSVVGSWLDEAAAKINDIIPGGETGEQTLARTRAIGRIQDQDHAGAATLSKLAGAILTGAPFLRGAQSTIGTIGRGIAGGTVYGGVYGAGEGETPEERRELAETGAQIGAVMGGAVPAVMAGGARAVAPVVDRLKPIAERMKRDPDDAARAIIARKIQESGSTPRELARDIQKMAKHDTRLDSNSFVGYVEGSGRKFGNNAETLADSSDSLQRLAGSVYRTGGRGAQRIRDTLDGRQIGPRNRFAGRQDGEFAGQSALVEDAVARSLVIKGQKGAFATERGLVAAQRAEGKALYEKAFQDAEPFKITTELRAVKAYAAEQPANVQRQLEKAARFFTRKGKPVTTLKQFDDSKKALDDMIGKAQRAGKGNLVRQLTDIKNGLLDKVHADGKNAAYQKARAAWGSGAERREALEMGRKALRGDSEMTVAQFNSLTPGQQALFRVGFRQAVKNAQGSKRPGGNVAQLFEQQRVQELMSEVIPRTEGKGVFSNRPERFGNFLDREGRKVSTRQRVLGGSPTAERVSDDMELAGDTLGELFGRFRQSPSLANMALEAITSGARRIFGFRKEVGEALARRLMETDPVERMKILREIQRATKPDQFAAFMAGLDEMAVSVGVSVSRPVISNEANR